MGWERVARRGLEGQYRCTHDGIVARLKVHARRTGLMTNPVLESCFEIDSCSMRMRWFETENLQLTGREGIRVGCAPLNEGSEAALLRDAEWNDGKNYVCVCVYIYILLVECLLDLARYRSIKSYSSLLVSTNGWFVWN